MPKYQFLSLFMLIAGCIPSPNSTDGSGSGGASALTSVKISTNNLAQGYKVSGTLALTVEALDGIWIKNSNGQMSQNFSANLSQGSAVDISVTKNKQYKFLMTGSVIKDGTATPKSVKSCDAGVTPVLVNQDNQTVPIKLCDEANVAVTADTTNVTIEPTYTPTNSTLDPVARANLCKTDPRVNQTLTYVYDETCTTSGGVGCIENLPCRYK